MNALNLILIIQHAIVGLGLAVLGGARLGTAWQGIIFTARRSAMHCMAWLGTVGLGSAWQGMAWRGTIFAGHGMVWRGRAGRGIAPLRQAGLGEAPQGMDSPSERGAL